MGNNNSINKISFKDMQHIIKNENYIVINTLNDDNQQCLIKGTISAQQELVLFNNYFTSVKDKSVAIYGANSNCEKIVVKYSQLCNMGFKKVYIYIGGLFEWLLLKDIYGEDEFPTTTKDYEILNYKPTDMITNILRLH